jgi:hypothetical protein
MGVIQNQFGKAYPFLPPPFPFAILTNFSFPAKDSSILKILNVTKNRTAVFN